MKKLTFAAPVLIALVAACTDPPPPSLASVTIQDISNDDAVGVTYIVDDGIQQADPTKGIFLGDGLSVALTTRRKIADPPEKSAEKDALLNKPFTLNVTGDVFKVVKTPESSRIIIHAVKPGDGTLVFAVDGATGTIVMPVKVVEQDAVPADIQPPKPVATTPEAGTSKPSEESDAGAEGGT